MRWAQQTIGEDETTRLPGVSGDAVVRHFDAPEALDTRFYEVRAKSALNRVPGAGRLPFGWTVNPYRGCSHACKFCAWGGTPILMGDGTTRPLSDLQVGDEIYGTVLEGRYRRYVKTQVLDHWSSIKPAYRVTLEDGTELVTSGDHRFLTTRGWKHVTGAMAGRDQRPYLTLNSHLLGTGGYVAGPARTADYRRGYLCGLIRGDGSLASQPYLRKNGRSAVQHFSGLALADQQALDRAADYLRQIDVETTQLVFHAGTANHRQVDAIRHQTRSGVEAIGDHIRWPVAPSEDWRKGFLAGIFDAEGSCGNVGALRIGTTDEAIVRWTEACLSHFGFDVVVEPPRQNGLKCVRLRGGLRERLRFFHLTDPAITRKRDMEGLAVKSDANLQVASIEPLGMVMRLFDITTGTGDFIANGVVSHNCFARPTHTYLDFNAAEDFEREIVVKVNVPEVLRAELARPSWKGEHVALGTNTDPYQWVEGRYELMRGIWEALRDASNPCSILTRSPLVLRDLDLLLEIRKRTHFTACFSLPTIDEKIWRETEPRSPNPMKRLEAISELNRAGIPTGILIAPLMPGINDAPEQVEKIVALADEAGATSMGGQALFLRGETRDVFMGWLRHRRPDLVEHYERLYANRAYLRGAEKAEVERGLPRRRRKSEHRQPTAAEAATGLTPQRNRAVKPNAPEAPDKQPVQGVLF
jgi:DNA repair photolyase